MLSLCLSVGVGYFILWKWTCPWIKALYKYLDIVWPLEEEKMNKQQYEPYFMHFILCFYFWWRFFLSILLRVGMVERGAAGWFRDRYQDLLWWRRTEEQQTLPFPPRHSQSCCCGSGQLSGRTYSRDSTVFLVVSGVTCGLQCLLHQQGGDIRGETDLAPGLKDEGGGWGYHWSW